VSIKEIMTLANSEVFFAVLFVIGLMVVGKWFFNHMKEQREENREREGQLIEIYKGEIDKSAKREEKLMTHLEKNTEQMEKISGTLDIIQSNMSQLETKVDSNLTSVWKELGGKADK
jgi:ABC-type bacteriocin/lantibiotic exporter with double-glycine peptidase domain